MPDEQAYRIALSVLKAGERGDPMPDVPGTHEQRAVLLALYRRALKRCGHKVTRCS